MPTVPSYDGRTVNIQQIGSPSLSMNAPDASGLSQGLNRVENSAIDYVQKERENADTAALLDADRKLNDWKTAAMFDPKSGVYTRKGQNALDITNQTLPGYDKHVEEVMGGLGNEQQKARFKIVAARQREALSGELNRYEYNERQTWYNESDEASKEGAANSAALYYNRPDQMAGYLNKGLAVIESQGMRNGWSAEKVEQERQTFSSGIHLSAIDRLMSENPNEALARYSEVKDSMTADDQEKVEKVADAFVQKQAGESFANSLITDGSAENYAGALSKVMAMPDGPARDAAEARLRDFKSLTDANDKVLYEQAAETVKNGGYGSLSPDMYRALSPENLVKLKRMDKALREGVDIETTPGKLDEFLTMQPEKPANLSLERDIRPYLSKTDYTTVQSAWTAARKGDGSVQGVAKAENENLNYTMSKAGIKTGSSKDALKPENLQQQDQFRSAYQSRRDSFVKINGREPSVEEAQGLAEMLLMDVKLTSTWRDSSAKLWEVSPEDADKVYVETDIGVEAVPASDRRQIVTALREQGVPVSEETIVAAYQNKLRANNLEIK